ncbi:MAG: hypothetical protein FJ206_07030 [Gemmatimonadetes bacterium]|nr:hypothetical protein [Gemmatimonadota bacterium]
MPRSFLPRARWAIDAELTLAGSLFALQPPLADNLTPDAAADAARQALDKGLPWQATRLLAPLVHNPETTAPGSLLLASRAAAQWEGWGTVTRLLIRRPWLDLDSTGEGHALLGRALLERGEAPLALRHTRKAVAMARAAPRGERWVWHARALDRLGQLDSAEAAYRAAADALPQLAEWLWLRAAGVAADSAARKELYDRLRTPAARSRIAWTEALAWERRGDSVRAARRYRALGARLAAARLDLGGDRTARRQARTELLALLAPGRPPEETAEAIVLLDRTGRLGPQDGLRVARRAAAIDLLERAARGFEAHPTGLSDRDRFSYATVLSRLGRFEEALPLFDAVRTPDLMGDAQYQRARMLIRNGQTDRGLAALRTIPARFPADSEPAASALFLLGDLHADRGADDSARRLFLEASQRYPSTPFGQRAGLQAAMIAWLDGDNRAAIEEFDRIANAPNHSESLAAAFWAARSVARLGDSAQASRRFAAVIRRAPESYYAARSIGRLGSRSPIDRGAQVDRGDPISPALARVRALGALGLRLEARFELEAILGNPGSGGEAMIATARELARARWHAEALRVALRAQAAGGSGSGAIWELLYPLPFSDLLHASAGRSRASMSLVAGVIRQESRFDPAARSSADARGLMQVLPSVGAAAVRPLGIEWDPSLLYQPDLNIDLGVRHLDEALAQLDWPERAVAAYNGGIDRVRRWQSIRGTRDDPEVFVERIPFTETRDYVRKVLANQAIYAALYPETSR